MLLFIFYFVQKVKSNSNYIIQQKLQCSGTCADIYLNYCLFLDLKLHNESLLDGGAIFIAQNCSVIIQQCIFDQCIAERSGGAVYICAGYDDWPNVFISDFMIKNSKMQYCCFQECYCFANDRSSSVLVLSSRETDFQYVNTVKCPPYGLEMRTSQMCLISDKLLISEYINLTQGNSIYAAGIEVFNISKSVFRFNSFCGMTGSFVVYYHLLISDSEISYCNFIDNTIKDIHTPDFSPALIYVGKKNVVIKNCIFYHSNLIETAIIATYDYVYGTEPQTIIVIDCYADSIYGRQDFITIKNCNFQIPYEEITFYNFNHFNCGEYEVKTETLTETQTNLAYFIPTYSYSQVLVAIKSATFSIVYSNSYTHIGYFDENENTFVYSLSNVYAESFTLFIMTYITNSYVHAIVSKSKPQKPKITQAKLIGIICGSVAILFIICCGCFLIYNKVEYGYFLIEDIISDDLSCSSDYLKTVNKKVDVEVEIEPQGLNKNDDDWI